MQAFHALCNSGALNDVSWSSISLFSTESEQLQYWAPLQTPLATSRSCFKLNFK